ncbi:MAG: PQQ-binding-like beta-propeller repeat protein [Candidatus Rickettsia vulgarisii]
MKKQLLVIFTLPFLLAACDLVSKKSKTITELTPKLLAETNEPLKIDSAINSFSPQMLNGKEYTIAKNKIISEPVFYNDIIYTIDIKGNVTAFSNNTKSIVWSYNISNKSDDHYIGGGVLHHNEKLYVTHGSRFLVILDSRSGHEITRKELPDIIRTKPVLIDNNTIVIQTVSNQILAINIEKLDFIWQHEGMPETLLSSYHSDPIVYNNYILVNYSSGQIIALDRKGQIVWGTDTSDNQQEIGLPNFETSAMLCKPLVHDHHIYLASSTGKIVKINIIDGKIAWQAKAEDVQSMSLSGNNLFVTNNAGQVAALSTYSGKIKFAADLNDPKAKKTKTSSFLAPIIAKNDNAWSLNVISNKGVLYSFISDASGVLNQQPQISKIAKNIKFYGDINSNLMYFITDKKIIFINQ